MPAYRLNPFIEPYLHVNATGLIKKLDFDFKGNLVEISGTMKMHHDNLKVVIMKKNSNDKNKLLSVIANLFIKNSSDKFPKSVTVDHVKRDNTKSFFNLLWKGLENGLAKTLIGINYKTTTETVKNIASDIKDATSAVKNVKSKLETPKKDEPKKKEGFFERLLK
jgi:hypothetical protein